MWDMGVIVGVVLISAVKHSPVSILEQCGKPGGGLCPFFHTVQRSATPEPSTNDKLTTNFRISIYPFEPLHKVTFFVTGPLFSCFLVLRQSCDHANTTAAELSLHTTASSCRVDDLIRLWGV